MGEHPLQEMARWMTIHHRCQSCSTAAKVAAYSCTHTAAMYAAIACSCFWASDAVPFWYSRFLSDNILHLCERSRKLHSTQLLLEQLICLSRHLRKADYLSLVQLAKGAAATRSVTHVGWIESKASCHLLNAVAKACGFLLPAVLLYCVVVSVLSGSLNVSETILFSFVAYSN